MIQRLRLFKQAAAEEKCCVGFKEPHLRHMPHATRHMPSHVVRRGAPLHSLSLMRYVIVLLWGQPFRRGHQNSFLLMIGTDDTGDHDSQSRILSG